MPLDLYYSPSSAPCRAVLMVAEALKLQLNLKPVKMMEREHLTPEYLKLNPQHTIPTLVDDGFALWESRAINAYLVSKYAKGSSLYPEDPQARAVIDQRLHFDIGLYAKFTDYMLPQLISKQPADEAKAKKVEEALALLEIFLEGKQWVAGDKMTIADFSIVASVSNFGAFDIDIFKYPNIKAWYNRMKTTAPGFSRNEEGMLYFKKMVDSFKSA